MGDGNGATYRGSDEWEMGGRLVMVMLITCVRMSTSTDYDGRFSHISANL